MVLTKITTSELEPAMHQIANYYRKSRLYLDVSNTLDAYQYYIDTYTEDTKVIIEQGHSYKYKGGYLIACDLNRLKEEHPDVYEHYFGIVPAIERYISRQALPAMFICAIGPKSDYISRDEYKLINTFAKQVTGYILWTDCPVNNDIKDFPHRTKSYAVLIDGAEYFRWRSN